MAEYKLNFPIETPEAQLFWGSRHKLNRIKAIIAFSLDLDNANDNLRRAGYYRQYRKKYLDLYDCYVAQPDMANVPFSELEESWWNPTAVCGTTPPTPVPISIIANTPLTGKIGDVLTFSWAGNKKPFLVTVEHETDGTIVDKVVYNLNTYSYTTTKIGKYKITVEDSDGDSIVSNETDIQTVVITTQPADFSGMVGDVVTYSIVAHNGTVGDTTGLTYQWQASVDEINWANVGTSSPNFSSGVSTAPVSNAWFRCIVTNNVNTQSVESRHATLNITPAHTYYVGFRQNPSPVPPQTTAPYTQIAEGHQTLDTSSVADTIMYVTHYLNGTTNPASGSNILQISTLDYDNTLFTAIVSADFNTLTIHPLRTGTGKLKVTSTDGTAYGELDITLSPPPPPAPTFTTQPGTHYTTGTAPVVDHYFTAYQKGGKLEISPAVVTGATSYKWQVSADGTSSWSDVPSQTDLGITIASGSDADEGFYKLIATNAGGSTESSIVEVINMYLELAADAGPDKPVKDATDDTKYTQTTTVSSGDYYFSGRSNRASTNSRLNYPGTTTSIVHVTWASTNTAVFPVTPVETNGQVHLGFNSAGTSTVTVTFGNLSSTMDVTVTAPVISVGTQPANTTVFVGQPITLTTAATVVPSRTLTYQWRKGGVNISGATTATYTIPTAATTDAGSFDCVIKANGAADVTTNAATVAVNAGVISFTSTATGTAGVNKTVVATSTNPTSTIVYSVTGAGASIGSSTGILVTTAVGSVTVTATGNRGETAATQIIVMAAPALTGMIFTKTSGSAAATLTNGQVGGTAVYTSGTLQNSVITVTPSPALAVLPAISVGAYVMDSGLATVINIDQVTANSFRINSIAAIVQSTGHLDISVAGNVIPARRLSTVTNL